jgi:hypothetical protein
MFFKWSIKDKKELFYRFRRKERDDFRKEWGQNHD